MQCPKFGLARDIAVVICSGVTSQISNAYVITTGNVFHDGAGIFWRREPEVGSPIPRPSHTIP